MAAALLLFFLCPPLGLWEVTKAELESLYPWELDSPDISDDND